MNYNTILNIAGAFVFAEGIFAEVVAYRLAKADRTYFKTPDGLVPWWRPGSGLQVWKMTFDPHLPGAMHDRRIKRDIYVLRVCFIVSLICAAVFAYISYKYVWIPWAQQSP